MNYQDKRNISEGRGPRSRTGTAWLAFLFAGMLFSLGCGSDSQQPPQPPELVQPTVIVDSYHTAEQMLLANEINESGEPFAEALGYDLDALDPMVPGQPDDTAYILGIENYEYSRYQLGTVISRSGIGLHMLWAPVISKMAAMEPDDFDGSMTGTPNGMKEDDELMKNIMNFSTQSGHMPPGNPWPEFAEFSSADPHLPQAVDADKFAWEDFSTLRWERSKMDMVLNPAALGQAMMKQYLWAQDMLSAFHDGEDNGIEPDGSVSPDFPDSPDFDPDNDVYLGGDSLDGFVGQVLTAEAINKTAFITGKLAYDGNHLGAIDLMTYDPANGIQYFPHQVKVTESQMAVGVPPQPATLDVIDDSSVLFDQASFLWALASFADMMDPNIDSDPAHLAYHEVFDGNPFPPAMSQSGSPGPYDLMKGTAKAVFLNLLALHFDETNQVFVAEAALQNGQAVAGDEVDLLGSAYLLVALEPFISEFAGTPLEQRARQAVEQQADFLVGHLASGNGVYGERYSLATGSVTGAQTLAAQSAAVRGLYVAARVSGRADLAQAAGAAYQALVDEFWVPEQKLFVTEIGSKQVTYTPANFALVAGALREAALQSGQQQAVDLYIDLFKRVAEKMQLAEGANTGETGGDSDQDGIPYIPEQPDRLPPVFASRAVFQLP